LPPIFLSFPFHPAFHSDYTLIAVSLQLREKIIGSIRSRQGRSKNSTGNGRRIVKGGGMFRLRFLVILAVMLVYGCASAQHGQRNAAWSTYRSEIIAQRDEGKLTPLQAQLDLWSKYREVYGEDPVMNGFYAYSVQLMSAVDSGKMSLDEAQVLIDAREREITAQRVAAAERRLAYDPYGGPSD
jgi:hypothetical protein